MYDALRYIDIIDTDTTIYVETTGDDITGDGSVGLPFATLARALVFLEGYTISGCMVTIQMGTGTFEVTENCLISALRINSVLNGGVQIQGTVTDSGTLTLTELSTGRYSVTEGISSADQYHDYLLKVSAINWYPIGKHDTSEFRIPGSALSGSYTIGLMSTNLIARSVSVGNTAIPLTTSALLLQLGSSGQEFPLAGSALISYNYLLIEAEDQVAVKNAQLHIVSIYSSILKPSSGFSKSMFIQDNVAFSSLAIDHSVVDISNNSSTGRLGYINSISRFSYSRFIGISSQTCLDFPHMSGNYYIFYCLFEGFNLVFNSEFNEINFNTYQNRAIYIDCSLIFNWRAGQLHLGTKYTPALSLYNVDYLLKVNSGDNANIYLPESLIEGTPNIDWLHPDSVNNGYYDPAIQMDIIIPGIFREVDTINDETLIDNGITYLVVGDLEQNRSIHLMYTIQRGSAYQEGVIRILNDGVQLFILDDFQTNEAGPLTVDLDTITVDDDTITADATFASTSIVGVSFSADINGTEIRLIATTTDEGVSATFKATVKRIMI